ncbi:protein kinase family protein [Actinopolymorpha alba]|uniref:protein kinase family protein n=1 Tax=Actinopolymorpha alba TaxID=533267 RepID=UPI000381E31B|nr:protein kinase family protein [Actinopolymorpha alba]
MHPTDVDPGVTLAGRYRVAELLAETPGDGGVAQTWRAVDEVLSRSVVVHVLAADDPRSEGLLEASRRAATAADVRFIRVLDAMRDDGVAYVVREWVPGRSLGTVLADGPLPPQQAGLVVREVAEALARAHEQDLAHQRLDPDSIVVTDAGSIKIVGLATQAALTTSGGSGEGDPIRADAVGLGRLLYAALTARWPTGPRSGLDAAPRAADGTLLSPRQCRAGVPRSLDEITERILSDRPRNGASLTTPREIATALTEVVGVTPIEGVLPPSNRPADLGAPASRANAAYAGEATQVGGRPVDPGLSHHNGSGPTRPRMEAARASGPGAPGQAAAANAQTAAFRPRAAYAPARPSNPAYAPSQRSAPRWWRIAGVFIGLVLLAGAGLLAWQLMSQAFNSGGPSETTSPKNTPSPSASSAAARGTPVAIAGARDYDPPPEGNGEEHPNEVQLAYDGKPGTAWRTMSYRGDPRLGRLKDGVGIWFDLGSVQEVSSVELTLVGTGTDLELRAAPEEASSAPAAADDWQKVAESEGAGTQVTLNLEKPSRTRYLLVWLTKLPPDGGEFRGGVAEIVVRR